MLKKLHFKSWLLMLCMLLGVGNAWAADETITFSEQGYDNGEVVETVSGTDFSIAFDKGSNSNAPKYYTSGTAIRAYGGNTMTVSSTKSIAKIEITFGSSDGSNAITTSVGTYSNGTWTGEATSVTFTIGGTSGHRRLASIAVTYVGTTPIVEKVAMPTFSPEAGSVVAGTKVEISSETSGATIYYTLDGNDPTTTSAVYNDPLSINETTTIKAIAVKEGMDNSDIATAEYTILAIEDGVFNFECKLFDYGSGVKTTTDGNHYEDGPSTWTAINVTLVAGGNYRWWSNDGTLRFQKGNGSMTISVPEGKVITEIAITGGLQWETEIGEYSISTGKWTGLARSVSLSSIEEKANNVKTVTVTYEDGEAPATVSVPTFNPAAGEVVVGTAVSIVCPSDATGVEYSLDNSTWQAYAEPIEITEAITIYARAYNGEGIKSEVVSAAYTIKEDAPAYETVPLPYEETLISGTGKFVIENVSLGGLKEVWKTSKYGMTANGLNCTDAIESWFVSPLINTTGSSSLSATFEQNLRYFASSAVAKEQATLWVREGASGTWTQLEIPTMENVNNNNFTSAGVIDLSVYAGKTIQLGFKYLATTENPGRWEVKNLSIVAGEIKKPAGLSYDVATFTATIGEDNEFPVLANPNDLTVAYSSTNEDAATIDAATGEITLLAAGQTTIKAVTEGNDDYEAGEASYLLVVKEQEVAGTDKFVLVTDASTLAAGDVIILAYVNEGGDALALSTTQNANNRAANSVEIEEDGTIIPGSSIQQITLEEGFYFNVGDGYLYAASAGSNWLRTETEADDNAKATIEIAENGDATIIFQGANTHNHLRFNANTNNGSPMFSCYEETSSVKTLPRIYRKVATEVVKVTVSSVGYATFSSTKALDFTGKAIEAYIATLDGSNAVKFTRVNKVPTNTGLLLHAEGGASVDVPVLSGDADPVDGNVMIAVSETIESLASVDDDGANYILNKVGDNVGFYKAAYNKVAAGRAYIHVPANVGVKGFALPGDNETGINFVEANKEDNVIYNLAGQRVNKAVRGLYIMNGKKVLVK